MLFFLINATWLLITKREKLKTRFFNLTKKLKLLRLSSLRLISPKLSTQVNLTLRKQNLIASGWNKEDMISSQRLKNMVFQVSCTRKIDLSILIGYMHS